MNNKVEEKKDFLREEGYFVDHLWHCDDVQAICDCDRVAAQAILYKALTNEETMAQIWYAIREAAENKGFKINDTIL